MIFDIFRKSGISRATTSQQLAALLSQGGESSSGVDVNPVTAAKFGTVFACLQVRAESVGQLPAQLFEERTEREKRCAKDHPLWNLLHNAPSEVMTAQEFWEYVSVCLDLRGNAYAFINRVNGKIFELLPLDPSWVTVKLTQQTRDLVYEVRVPFTDMKLYTAKDILHVKRMSLNSYTGASIIEQARDTIGLGMAMERHGSRFFKNGGAPGGVLKTEQMLSDGVMKNLEESWADTHGGLDNAHRIAILEAGLSWQAVGMPLRDVQFLEGRHFSRTEICGLFRVPPHLVGDLSRATFSNIEQQGLDFVIHGLMPTLTRIEQRCNLQLLTEEERKTFFLKFNVRALVRGDMAGRGAFYNTMVNVGAYSPNDIRDLEDMNAREGGDVYLTPMNMQQSGPDAVAPDTNAPKDPNAVPGTDPALPGGEPAKPKDPAQGETP